MLNKKILTYDPKKGKKVLAGSFCDGAFIKHVKPKHFMKKEQGYGIQEDVIQKLKSLKCETVFISTDEHTYEIPFTLWLEAPIRDYGSGQQRFIRLNLNSSQLTIF